MSHELFEQLATHTLAVRFGDGPEGLARGVGLTVVRADWLPWRALLVRSDVLLVRDDDSILWGVAEVLLACYAHAEADVEELAGKLLKT